MKKWLLLLCVSVSQLDAARCVPGGQKRGQKRGREEAVEALSAEAERGVAFVTDPGQGLRAVLSYFPAQELMRAGRVCKDWLDLSRGERMLPYRLLLPAGARLRQGDRI